MKERDLIDTTEYENFLDEHITKKHAGRPPTYNEKLHPLFAASLAKIGYSEKEIAREMEIDPLTLYRWKSDHPEFCKALTIRKNVANGRVEKTLFNVANGYDYQEEEIVKLKRPDGSEDFEIVKVTRHVAPNVGAIKHWQCNRDPNRWHDKQNLDVNATVTGKIVTTSTPMSPADRAREIAELTGQTVADDTGTV